MMVILGEEGDHRAGIDQDPLLTSEAFHVGRVGAEVGGQALGRAENAQPLGEIGGNRGAVSAGARAASSTLRTISEGADALFPGFGLELLLEFRFRP